MCPRAWIRARTRTHAHARAMVWASASVACTLKRVSLSRARVIARTRDGRASASLG
jgi:hypothetical protein